MVLVVTLSRQAQALDLVKIICIAVIAREGAVLPFMIVRFVQMSIVISIPRNG